MKNKFYIAFLMVFLIPIFGHAQAIEFVTERTVLDGDTLVDNTTVEVIKINLTKELMVYTLFEDGQLLYSKKDRISNLKFNHGITMFDADKSFYTLEMHENNCVLTTEATLVRIGKCQVDFSIMRK
jgi:hypothetical protein